MPTYRDLLADSSGDLDLSDGKGARLVADAAAIGQQVARRLRTFKGEWPIDVDLGVDYLGQVFGPGDRTALAAAEIKAAILDVPGVAALDAFALRVDNGSAIVTFTARTDLDELTSATVAINGA